MKSKCDFYTTEEYTKEDVAEVQAKLLEMAKIVAKIFDQNNVRYMLAFGSLLGAVRGGGLSLGMTIWISLFWKMTMNQP